MIHIRVDNSIKCVDEYALFVSFDYDKSVVEVIKNLPIRYWHVDTKEWEMPLSKLEPLLNDLKDFDIEIFIDDPTVLSPKEVEIPKEFEFKTQPFSHQIEGFKYGLSKNKWLLGDEQGLGKTKQIIDIAVAKKLTCGYEHTLIICGVNGLKWNWQKEIATHSNETGYILGQREKGGKTVIGSTKDKIHDLEHLNAISSHFIITNVESLRDEKISSLLAKYCAEKVIGVVAVDEFHKIKNPTSQQSKGVLKLKADYMVAMTGTPLMNSPMDLYIILKWLGYENHAFYSFKKHYCEMGGYGGYQIVGYRHLDELQERLDSIMLRRLKDDVLDLPEKLFIDEYVDMTAKQEQIYKEVAMSIKSNIDQIKMSNNPLSELIRMRQATGYTGILSSSIQESAKLDRMEELVEEAVENGKKVVIFSNWTQMTEQIVERTKKNYKYAIITGETSDSLRQSMVDDFQNNPNCKVIIGTIGAMGTGLTLTAGTVVIFMDEPWTMANKEQAIDRCHRIGTKSNVTIYTLMCKNTIDERIHEIVVQKGAMSDMIVDGKVTDKSALIDFLLD